MYKTAINVLNRLDNNGFKAYVVGGYPRDLYLNRECIDIDICTNATAKDIKDIFKDANVSKVQYGSVTIFINNIRFELTTFRKDLKYKNNRLPVKIKYIDSLVDDLKRRDFIINTMCMDKNGTIIDLLNAKKDLDEKLIRVVGNSKRKLKEDSLRILRAIRFATVLDFDLDDNLKVAIKKYGYLLSKLSYYRKKEELEKIFSSPNVRYGLRLIKELGLVKPLQLSNFDDLVITTDLIGIWAQLDVVDKYDFTRNEKEQITKINELLNKDILDNYNLYSYGLYISCIAGEIKHIDRKDIYDRYYKLQINELSDIAISADDICDVLGKKPGSYLRDIFKDIESKILYNELFNGRDELISYVKDKYKSV